MAARGAAATELKLRTYSENLAGLAAREASVLHAFEQANPGGVGTVVEFNPDPKLAKLAVKLAATVQSALQARGDARREKKFLQKERRLENKIARREAATADLAEVRVSEAYGPNAGYWSERGAPPPLWLFR